MVERHEGSESAAIARYWLGRQPDAFHVNRSIDGDLIGFHANLRLEAVTPEDLAVDPAMAQAVAYIERHGPLRTGEHIRMVAGWIASAIRRSRKCSHWSRRVARRVGSPRTWRGARRYGGSRPHGTDVHRDPHSACARGGFRDRRAPLWRICARLASGVGAEWLRLKAERARRSKARPPRLPNRRERNRCQRPTPGGTHSIKCPVTLLEQRIVWHIAHAKACACREIPPRIVKALKSLGIPIPRRTRLDLPPLASQR